jgi:transposase
MAPRLKLPISKPQLWIGFGDLLLCLRHADRHGGAYGQLRIEIRTKGPELEYYLRIPPAARGVLDILARQYSAIGTEIGSSDKNILASHRACEASRRLAEIPGIGPIVATALVAEIGYWKAFASGRNLAAWIGLVPKQHTTGGKTGSAASPSRAYLRWLLVVGATAVIRYAQKHGTKNRPWLARLMERRPPKVAAVALANKIARIAQAIMVHGDRYNEPKLSMAA